MGEMRPDPSYGNAEWGTVRLAPHLKYFADSYYIKSTSTLLVNLQTSLSLTYAPFTHEHIIYLIYMFEKYRALHRKSIHQEGHEIEAEPQVINSKPNNSADIDEMRSRPILAVSRSRLHCEGQHSTFIKVISLQTDCLRVMTSLEPENGCHCVKIKQPEVGVTTNNTPFFQTAINSHAVDTGLSGEQTSVLELHRVNNTVTDVSVVWESLKLLFNRLASQRSAVWFNRSLTCNLAELPGLPVPVSLPPASSLAYSTATGSTSGICHKSIDDDDLGDGDGREKGEFGLSSSLTTLLTSSLAVSSLPIWPQADNTSPDLALNPQRGQPLDRVQALIRAQHMLTILAENTGLHLHHRSVCDHIYALQASINITDNRNLDIKRCPQSWQRTQDCICIIDQSVDHIYALQASINVTDNRNLDVNRCPQSWQRTEDCVCIIDQSVTISTRYRLQSILLIIVTWTLRDAHNLGREHRIASALSISLWTISTRYRLQSMLLIIVTWTLRDAHNLGREHRIASASSISLWTISTRYRLQSMLLIIVTWTLRDAHNLGREHRIASALSINLWTISTR
ncbi:hypothetical protein J6590_046830 [Homalodisca vitripennis]|nr:hypothetical protein J6590_046830 [Homalodisca vitripennis]